jgi:hypothetical protein
LASLALACAACSGNDDPVTTVDQGTAQQQALGVVEVVDAMLARTDEIAAGDVGLGQAWIEPLDGATERASTDPTWDPEEERWVILVAYDWQGGGLTYLFTIQFTNPDGSHPMEPDTETTLAAYGLVADLHSQRYGNGDEIHSDLHYECGMDITGLEASSHHVVGNGTTTGTVTGTKDGRAIQYDLRLTSTVDAAIPRGGGCGSGTIAVDLAPYRLIAGYVAGVGSYAWRFTRGEAPLSSGTGSSACARGGGPKSLPEEPPRP